MGRAYGGAGIAGREFAQAIRAPPPLVSLSLRNNVKRENSQLNVSFVSQVSVMAHIKGSVEYTKGWK